MSIFLKVSNNLVFGILIAIFYFQSASAAKISKDITNELKEHDQVSVIVSLKGAKSQFNKAQHLGGGQWLNLQDYIGEAQQKLAKEMGWRNFNEIVRFKNTPAIAKTINANELKRLRESSEVQDIFLDRFNTLSLVQSSKSIGLGRINTSKYSGKGSAVAIIDTGIDEDHPFFQGRVIAGACFSKNASCANGKKVMLGQSAGQPCKEASCGHGTHVAGIVAGKNNKVQGVAPKANLLAVNVFSITDKGIGAYQSDQIQALEWVYENSVKYNIKAINMSLGGGYYQDYCDEETPSQFMVKLLASRGVATVAASGNEYYIDGVSSPGCLSDVISVGSTNPDNSISKFSNSYKRLNALAPGGKIYSSVPGGGYKVLSGTSMATPQVAGAVAVLTSAFPKASLIEIKKALKQGQLIKDPRNGIGTASLNVSRSITWLEEQSIKKTSKSSYKPARKSKDSSKRKSNCSKRVDGIWIQNTKGDCSKEIEW